MARAPAKFARRDPLQKQCSKRGCVEAVFALPSVTRSQWSCGVCDEHWRLHLDIVKKQLRRAMSGNQRGKRLRPTGSALKAKRYSAMDLCTGTGSMRAAMRATKFRSVWSMDVRTKCKKSNHQCFLHGTLLDSKFRKEVEAKDPDFASSSVPCEDFSTAKTAGAEKDGKAILRAVVSLYAAWRKKKARFVGIIENPRGRMRSLCKSILREYVNIETDHCQYCQRFAFLVDLPTPVVAPWIARSTSAAECGGKFPWGSRGFSSRSHGDRIGYCIIALTSWFLCLFCSMAVVCTRRKQSTKSAPTSGSTRRMRSSSS